MPAMLNISTAVLNITHVSLDLGTSDGQGFSTTLHLISEESTVVAVPQSCWPLTLWDP